VIPVHETSGGVTFAIKVHPRSKKNQIIGVIGDALKVSLTAPPADDRANQACLDFVCEQFNISRSSIAIISGHHSRNKVIRISGISPQHLIKILSSHLT
jgi:uncharacterized protein (TIGR00251 family)